MIYLYAKWWLNIVVLKTAECEVVMGSNPAYFTVKKNSEDRQGQCEYVNTVKSHLILSKNKL